MLKSVKLIALAAAAAFWSSSANADVYCVGNVLSSWVASDGGVYVLGSWRNDRIQICNISTAWKTIPPEVCAAWLAKLDAAMTLNKTLGIYYGGINDCTTLPTYSNAPAPYYVRP